MGRQHLIQEGSKETLSPKERILCYSGTTEIKWRQEKTKIRLKLTESSDDLTCPPKYLVNPGYRIESRKKKKKKP